MQDRGLLLKRKENNIWGDAGETWKRQKIGTKISFVKVFSGRSRGHRGEGNRLIQFTTRGHFRGDSGQTGPDALPPYITHQLKDKNRYQTVYAKHDGSAAAPQQAFISRRSFWRRSGLRVSLSLMSLHVGLETFRPVKVEDVTQHHMHLEFCVVEEDQALSSMRQRKRRKDFRRNYEPPYAGVRLHRGRHSESRKRLDRYFHLSRLPVQDRRPPDYQLPPPGVHPYHAGLRPGRKRTHHGSLRGGCEG